jgi:predicted O-methyltransferase YrrM
MSKASDFKKALHLAKQGEFRRIVSGGIRRTRHKVYKNTLSSRRIRQLKTQNDTAVQKVGRALSAVHSNGFTHEEQRCIDQILAYRRNLNQSSEEIVTTDYGESGNSTDGVERTVSVADYAKCDYIDGVILFHLMREFAPGSMLELGTGLGISAAYLGEAAKLNGHGTVTTLEGSPPAVEKARETLAELGLTNTTVEQGRFQEILPEVLEQNDSFDFVFIDGHHEKAAAKKYWRMIQPHMSDNGVMVLDDIDSYSGLAEAWNEICAEEGFHGVAEAGSFGIGVKSQMQRQVSPVRVYL